MVWVRFRTAFNLLLLIASFLFLMSIIAGVRPRAGERPEFALRDCTLAPEAGGWTPA